MRSERHQYNKRKKRRKWKYAFLIVFLLFVSIIAYSYFQFKQGVSQSKGKADIENVEYEFYGDTDQYDEMNILLLGSDARGEEKSRADTIMVAQYNPDKGTYKLISIMRDIYADIPGYGKHKINAAHAFGGPELLRKTIKENFDIDLQYYAIIDFKGFVHLIDEAFPNGVEVNVEKDMSANIGVRLEQGKQRLDGEHLLGYVRFRHDAIGDFGRVERQQKVMKEVASQITSFQTIAKLPKLVGVISPYINTNMDAADIFYIGQDFLTHNRKVETLRIPVDGSYENQRISGAGAVLAIDLQENRQAIHTFLSK